MNLWDALAEAKLQHAERAGEFRNLPGAGKPLPDDLDPIIPVELRLAMRVLKNAGVAPLEIERRKAILETEQALTVAKSQADNGIKRSLLIKLALLRTTQEGRASSSTHKNSLPI